MLTIPAVPCRDYAESHCAYGDYCSFIHDPTNLYDPIKHGKKVTKPTSTPSNTIKPPMLERPSSDSSTPSENIRTPSTDAASVVAQAEKKGVQPKSQSATSSSAGIETPSIVTDPTPGLDQRAVAAAPTLSSPSNTQTYEPPFDASGSVARGPIYTMSPAELSSGVGWVEWNPAWGTAQQWPTQQIPHTPWQVSVSPVNLTVNTSSPLSAGAHESSVIWTPEGFQVSDTSARTRGFWRTKPCRLYAQGVCPHGDNCSL